MSKIQDTIACNKLGRQCGPNFANMRTKRQKQMYVNYFDCDVKLDFEENIIGILLAKMKKDAWVKLTLSKNAISTPSSMSSACWTRPCNNRNLLRALKDLRVINCKGE